ncbi:hypothetical protein ACFQ3Z_44065 [Streptomyces nogalater]
MVTDLDAKVSVSYALKSSVDYPSGGGVKKYETATGDKLTETTTYNEATGTLVTTAVETLAPATGSPDTDVTGDEDADAAIGVADLTATYTWKQVAPGTDKWRVTSVGNVADGATATVSYDTKGRVATVSEPATADAPAQSLTVKYSAATTATGTALGEYTGRAKEITLTSGATTQTLARYSYDASGLLRNVTNPVEGTDPVSSYDYDSAGRVSDIASPSSGEWDLTFPAESAAPNAAPVGTDLPSATEPLQGRPATEPRPRLRPRTSPPVRSPTRRPTRATATAPRSGCGTSTAAASRGPRTTAGTGRTSGTRRPASAWRASSTTAAAPPAPTSAARADSTSGPRVTPTTTVTA